MGTEIVKGNEPKNEIDITIERMKDQWARVLPKICTPERFARMALSCIRKNKVLSEALTTADGKASVLSCLMSCAELGIEPDGRRAHLIPFKNSKGGYEITLIIDYKGIAELAMRSGLVSNIHADKICDKDMFEVNKGRIIHHVPNYKEPRGEAYAYYANVTFKDGSEKSEIMTLDEVTAISKRSKAVQNYDKRKKAGEYASETPWQTDFDEMAKKTVFKRLGKWIPLSPELRDAIEKDDEDFIDIQAEPVRPAKTSFLEKPKAAAIEENTSTQNENPPLEKPISLFDIFAGKPCTPAQAEEFLKATKKLPATAKLTDNKTLCKMIADNPDAFVSAVLEWQDAKGTK